MNPKVGERYKVTYTEDDWFIYEVASVHDDEYSLGISYKVLEAGLTSPHALGSSPIWSQGLTTMRRDSANWNNSEPLNSTINRGKLNKQVDELLK